MNALAQQTAAFDAMDSEGDRPSAGLTVTLTSAPDGNLTLALGMKLKQDGNLALIKGLYAMCPYIAGEWPLPQNPSSTENEGILISVWNIRSTMAYGIDAFNARNPLAWPGFAKREDVEGLPPVVISVNECGPSPGSRPDEGAAYRRRGRGNCAPKADIAPARDLTRRGPRGT